MRLLGCLYLVSFLLLGMKTPSNEFQWPSTLSEWQLFASPLADLKPEAGVIPYDVNAPLYSDYALKSRLIRLPPGKPAQFHATQAFDMPDGTVLVKNFFYAFDEKQPNKGRRILETRLIVRDKGKWHALAYRWNAEQTEAIRSIAGGSVDVSWTDNAGNKQQLHYLIPDANQCKNCHNKNDELLPLGIIARQLNNPGANNQLLKWKEAGMLIGLPDEPALIPRLVDYENVHNPLTLRARSYLDANCGHCHSPEGSARTSGLNLDFNETDPHAWGVMKPPVAAGRGSDDMQYSIVPGKPSHSILLYRMVSNDPGVRMPEINRQIPHREGIELIKEWIRTLQ